MLLLQVRNSSFLLPGGRLRPAEQGTYMQITQTCLTFWGNRLFDRASDVQGLKRKLSSKLAAADSNGDHHWQVTPTNYLTTLQSLHGRFSFFFNDFAVFARTRRYTLSMTRKNNYHYHLHLIDRGVHWHVVEIRIRGQTTSISASKPSCTQGKQF